MRFDPDAIWIPMRFDRKIRGSMRSLAGLTALARDFLVTASGGATPTPEGLAGRQSGPPQELL
ncbi:MAG: hypothetical protein AUG47_06265 [Alphaproteobacteria bacterium 13_1_20CM_3_64_12]|jgi:hypothetical protein|nr:MAG: hypothetical protein AUG47_06265 [Alphaproteobacteria bacterium 13_1_20CM_3_64_12]